MAHAGFTYGLLVAGITIGLILLVYGMSLTAGKSMNFVAMIGGIVSLGATGLMALLVARADHPTH